MADILIVDDDDIVARTIERTLRRHGFQTAVARSGVEALKTARRHRPDLVLLDVLMPGMDGYRTCQEMRRDPLLSELPVLFLTAKGKDSDIVEGFSAGADDYLPKPFNPEELILRIRAILRRTLASAVQPQSKSHRLEVGEVGLDSRTFQVHLRHGTFALTPVQFDLLYHLMIHAGETFSSHQLLQDVWDYPHDTGSPDLVRVHIKNLRQRIEVDPNTPVYVRTVPGHGYTFATENESGG
jgi:DNA-binding response OmpR family regulator